MSEIEKLNKVAVLVHKGDYIVVLAGQNDDENMWEYKNKVATSDGDTISYIYQHRYIRDITLTMINGDTGTTYIYNIDDTTNTEIELVDLDKEIVLSDKQSVEQLKSDLALCDDVELLYRGKDSTEFSLKILDVDIRMIFNNRYNILYNSKSMQVIF